MSTPKHPQPLLFLLSRCVTFRLILGTNDSARYRGVPRFARARSALPLWWLADAGQKRADQ